MITFPFPFPSLCGGGAAAAPANEHHFDAASSTYLSMSGANFGSPDFSNFAVFVRCTPTIVDSTSRYMMNQWAFGLDSSWVLYMTSGDVFAWTTRDVGQTSTTATGTTTIVAGTEYDVYATYNGTTMELFVDGVSEDTATPPADPNNVSKNVAIGARSAGATQLFDGTMHQATIFSGGFPAVGSLGSKAAPVVIHTLANVYSALDADTSVVDDFELATDWTNNNSVTTQVRT